MCLVAGLGAAQVHAIDRDTRSVIVAGVYGIGLGTAAGLASYPIHKSGRAIFMGTSIGLYLGIAAGIYHVTHRYDPGNPFGRPRSEVPVEVAVDRSIDPAQIARHSAPGEVVPEIFGNVVQFEF